MEVNENRKKDTYRTVKQHEALKKELKKQIEE